MDRQSLLLVALGLLAAAGLVVSVSGWMLFAKLRKGGAANEDTDGEADGADRATPSAEDDEV